MGRSADGRRRLSEQKKQYRSWTAQQKIAIVLAGVRGNRSVEEVCHEHEITDTPFYSWSDKLLEGGRERWRGRRSAAAIGSCAGRAASWSGRCVARPTSSRSRGKHCEAGSERARRPVSRAGRARLRRRGRGGPGADVDSQSLRPRLAARVQGVVATLPVYERIVVSSPAALAPVMSPWSRAVDRGGGVAAGAISGAGRRGRSSCLRSSGRAVR